MAITSMYLIKRRNKIILRTMEGKKSKDETLLDWIQNPITKVQREQNKANWLLAQNVVHLRKAEALKRDEGLDYATNCKSPFQEKNLIVINIVNAVKIISKNQRVFTSLGLP